jgi:hypothetical protein
MKKFIAFIFILSTQAQAEVVLSVVVKDGPNGYNASGNSSTSSTSSSTSKCCGIPASSSASSTTVNGVDISNRTQADMGFRAELLTKDSPFVFGLGAFQDTTIEGSIGIRLWQ